MGSSNAKQLPGPKDRLAAVVRIPPVDPDDNTEIKYAFYPKEGRPFEKDCTLKDLCDWYPLYDEKDVLVYIHGFKVNGTTAEEDAMALREGLKFKGPVLVINWVSVAALSADNRLPLADYLADVNTVNHEPTIKQVVKVLDALSRHFSTGQVHFVVHSLGAQLFFNAFKEFKGQNGDSVKPVFGEMFLFAPDVWWDASKTAGQFAEIETLLRASRRKSGVTVYQCSDDFALKASCIINGDDRADRHRAGLHNDDHELAHVNLRSKGIRNSGKVFHTVLCDEVVRQRVSHPRHSYYLQPEVLFHMRRLINKNEPRPMPSKCYLAARDTQKTQGLTWQLKCLDRFIHDWGIGSPTGHTCSLCESSCNWNRGCYGCVKIICRDCFANHFETCPFLREYARISN